MAVVSERVLVGPAHPGLFGGVLGILPHMTAAERVPESIVNHAVHHSLVPGLDTGPHTIDVVRSVGHRLLAPGDDTLGVARLDRLGREHHRLEPGTADLVDGERGNRGWEPSRDERLPG